MSGVERHYEDGKPRHIHAPDLSVLKVVSDTEFAVMTDSKVQSNFRRQHFVITGRKDVETDFKRAMGRLGHPGWTFVQANGMVCFFVHGLGLTTSTRSGDRQASAHGVERFFGANNVCR